MNVFPKDGKFKTSVEIPIGLREQIKARNMTIAGCLMQGLKAMDERLSWNQDKETRLKYLEAYRIQVIKQKAVKAMQDEVEKPKFDKSVYQ